MRTFGYYNGCPPSTNIGAISVANMSFQCCQHATAQRWHNIGPRQDANMMVADVHPTLAQYWLPTMLAARYSPTLAQYRTPTTCQHDGCRRPSNVGTMSVANNMPTYAKRSSASVGPTSLVIVMPTKIMPTLCQRWSNITIQLNADADESGELPTLAQCQLAILGACVILIKHTDLNNDQKK